MSVVVNLCDSSDEEQEQAEAEAGGRGREDRARAVVQRPVSNSARDELRVSIIEPAVTKGVKRAAASSSSPHSSSRGVRDIDSFSSREVACPACTFLNKECSLQCVVCFSDLRTSEQISSHTVDLAAAITAATAAAATAAAVGEDLLAMLLEGYDLPPNKPAASIVQASSSSSSGGDGADLARRKRPRTQTQEPPPPAPPPAPPLSQASASSSAAAAAARQPGSGAAMPMSSSPGPEPELEEPVCPRAAGTSESHLAAGAASAGTTSTATGKVSAKASAKEVLLCMDHRCPTHIIEAVRTAHADAKAGPMPFTAEAAALEGLCVWLKPVHEKTTQQRGMAKIANDSSSASTSCGETGAIIHSSGGLQTQMQLLPHAAVMFPPVQFLQLVLADELAVTFSQLALSMRRIRHVLASQGMPSNARVIIVLNSLKRAIETILSSQLNGKDGKEDRQSVAFKLKQAQAFLLVEHQVESVLFEHVEEVAQYMSSTSAYLAKAVSSKPLSELADVSSISLRKAKAHAEAAGDDSILHRAVWENMLMNINGMSAAKARHAVTHVDARCPVRAYEVFQQELQAAGFTAARERLRYVFSTKEERALSGRLFDALLCEDPAALVSLELELDEDTTPHQATSLSQQASLSLSQHQSQSQSQR